jgi:hypothetical protein
MRLYLTEKMSGSLTDKRREVEAKKVAELIGP